MIDPNDPNINTEVTEVQRADSKKFFCRKKPSNGKPRPQKFTRHRQEKFFQLLAETCNLTKSAKAVGVDPHTVYAHKYKYPEFKERLLQAQAEAYENLEASAFERAINGSKKGVYHNGVKIAEETVYHDNLTMFMMKNNIEKYKDSTQIELTGKNGGPIELSAAKNKLLDILNVTLEGEFTKE